jgi:hypothetical protein
MFLFFICLIYFLYEQIPEKKYFGKMNAELVKNRAAELELYLQALCKVVCIFVFYFNYFLVKNRAAQLELYLQALCKFFFFTDMYIFECVR